jgi:DNA primase small subunit
MNARDRQALARMFASYYDTADFRIPGLEQREFGIGNTRKIEARHLNFPNLQSFRGYLTINTPFFVSHSTSYYDFPGATPIQKKGRRGADLVFDLDVHAEGKYGAYAKLGQVKEDLQRLVKDFIINDFGCRDVLVAFSGNRGYHVHVRDKEFLPLGGEERRELVDYVMGNGLNYRAFFPSGLPGEKGHAGRNIHEKLIGPRPDEGGYRGRFARAVVETISQKPAGISRVFSKEKEREFFLGGVREGNWSKTSLKPDDLVSRFAPIAATLPVGSVDTDAGVTQDLSKLIRVPNSIHGETGLIAKIIDIGEIGRFEPFRDAFIPGGVKAADGAKEAEGAQEDGKGSAMTKEAVKVKFIEDVPALEMMGETIGPFKKGEEKELSLPVAVFFVAKESAAML